MEISMENISIQIKPSFYEAISYQRTYYERGTDSRPSSGTTGDIRHKLLGGNFCFHKIILCYYISV